jgi:hypothetical protein
MVLSASGTISRNCCLRIDRLIVADMSGTLAGSGCRYEAIESDSCEKMEVPISLQ